MHLLLPGLLQISKTKERPMDLNLNNYLVNNEVPKYVRLEKIAQRKKIVNHHDQA